jgi:flagellar hook-basal body complex protein FliE
MAYEFARLIQSDLAALVNDANGLAGSAVASPASLGGAAPDAGSFAQSMKDALGKVNQDDRLAAQRMADVDSGKSDDLAGAMLASQEASLSFSMLMQVRNKVMGAVDDLIKLPL